MVLGELGIDQFAAMGFEPRQRAFLVSAHQPAVARDIGRKDRRPACARPARLSRCPFPPFTPPYWHRNRSVSSEQQKSEGTAISASIRDQGVNSQLFPG
jgi:hypothetical protein